MSSVQSSDRAVRILPISLQVKQEYTGLTRALKSISTTSSAIANLLLRKGLLPLNIHRVEHSFRSFKLSTYVYFGFRSI